MRKYAEFFLQHFGALMYLVAIYSAVIAVCFVFGFWSAVKINILSYFSPIDLITLSMVPYLASLFISTSTLCLLVAVDKVATYTNSGKHGWNAILYNFIPVAIIAVSFFYVDYVVKIFIAILIGLILILVIILSIEGGFNKSKVVGVCLAIVSTPLCAYTWGIIQFQSDMRQHAVLVVEEGEELLPPGLYEYIGKVGDRLFVMGNDNEMLYGVNEEKMPVIKLKDFLKKDD